MQAIILAGGVGSRLGNIVKNTPKPFLTVKNNPFILNIVERLISQNVKDIIFCLGYKPQKIKRNMFLHILLKFLHLTYRNIVFTCFMFFGFFCNFYIF